MRFLCGDSLILYNKEFQAVSTATSLAKTLSWNTPEYLSCRLEYPGIPLEHPWNTPGMPLEYPWNSLACRVRPCRSESCRFRRTPWPPWTSRCVPKRIGGSLRCTDLATGALGGSVHRVPHACSAHARARCMNILCKFKLAAFLHMWLRSMSA